MEKNVFRHEQTEDKLVIQEGDEFKVWNWVAKKDKEDEIGHEDKIEKVGFFFLIIQIFKKIGI